MARKPKNPQADRAAKAIMDEFAPKTADDTQEPSRPFSGP